MAARTGWTTACPDWARRIVARESLVPCPPPFADKAADALGVFKSLQVTDLPQKRGGGWPTLGEVCEQYVFDLVGALFGAQDPDTGESWIKEALLLISKKNIKSTIAAGILITALVVNWRHGAEMLVLAPTIEIANNTFTPAARMVRADPELSVILKVIDHQRIIRHLDTEAEAKVVAADAGVVGGKKAAFVIVEELWLFGKKPNADAMLEEATGGQASRPEGWTLYLTTHSDEPPAGVFKKKLSYFRDVRDGVITDPSCLPMLYEWPEEMIEAETYLDPEYFYVTNPNIGKSTTVEFIQRKIEQAKAGEGSDGDSTLQVVLAKYLNVEIGLRLRRDRWRGADYWERCADPALTLEALIARSEVIVAGVDGGGLDDLYGLALIGRERETGKWLVWAKGWCDDGVLGLRKDIASSLRDFAAAGDLVICAEVGDDIEEIAQILLRTHETGLMPDKSSIGVDPIAIGPLLAELSMVGLEASDETGERAVSAVGQGYRLASSVWTIERMLKAGMLVHGGQPMLAWCVGNARASQRGNAVYIDKQVSGKAKIDPLVALFNAGKLMERNPAAVGKSFWEVAA